ncbi:MAG: hypothetical protein ACYC99_03850 [Candidatus Geothermincolia bacterium]
MIRKHIVQMPVDEETYSRVQECAKLCHTSQAQVMRRAFEDYYVRVLERQLDQEYREGYRNRPDDMDAADIQLSVLPEVLEEENW